MGVGQPTAEFNSFRIVESETPWYGSMRLDELNRAIPGCPGFDHLERSYSSAVSWARGKLGCTLCLGTKREEFYIT